MTSASSSTRSAKIQRTTATRRMVGMPTALRPTNSLSHTCAGRSRSRAIEDLRRRWRSQVMSVVPPPSRGWGTIVSPPSERRAPRPATLPDTADDDFNIISFRQTCLSNALRLETHIENAERADDAELQRCSGARRSSVTRAGAPQAAAACAPRDVARPAAAPAGQAPAYQSMRRLMLRRAEEHTPSGARYRRRVRIGRRRPVRPRRHRHRPGRWIGQRTGRRVRHWARARTGNRIRIR